MTLYPKITRPSRVITHSATLIDNIVTNDIENNTVSGLLLSDISDHLPVFMIYDNNYRYKRPEQTAYKQIRTNESRDGLKLELLTYNWDTVYKYCIDFGRSRPRLRQSC